MPSAFSATEVTESESDLFLASSDGGPVAAMMFTNDDGSAGTLLLNVVGLHKADEWFPVPPGESQGFRSGNQGIIRVRAKAEGGDVTASGGVVAKL